MFKCQVNLVLGQFAEAFVGGELRPDWPHLVRSKERQERKERFYLKIGAVRIIFSVDGGRD